MLSNVYLGLARGLGVLDVVFVPCELVVVSAPLEPGGAAKSLSRAPRLFPQAPRRLKSRRVTAGAAGAHRKLTSCALI